MKNFIKIIVLLFAFTVNAQSLISIESTRELPVDMISRDSGIIAVEIVNFEKKINEGIWRLTLKDYIIKEEIVGQDSVGQDIIQEIKTEITTRFSEYTDEEMNTLSALVNLPAPDASELAEFVEEVFRQGLLLKTQQECLQGKGIYFSEAQDWVIINEDGTARPL